MIDLWSDSDEFEDEWVVREQFGRWPPSAPSSSRAISVLAYLAWLLAVQDDRVAPSSKGPSVPPGLRELSAPLLGMMQFLRIDPDLVAAAAFTDRLTALRNRRRLGYLKSVKLALGE